MTTVKPMSEYENFIQDFPNRCSDILRNFYSDAEKLNGGREITLMLMTASSGFKVPYEQLRYRNPEEQHIANTAVVYPSPVSDLLGTKFIKSFFYKRSKKSRIVGKFKPGDRVNINQWTEVLECEKSDENLNVECVVNIIRNSLAHGSIYTLAENESVIDIIILVSENKKESSGEEYRFLKISTEDFKSFFI
jgi:hypothetical protein